MNRQTLKNRMIKDYIALRKEQNVRNFFNQIMITDPKTCFEAEEFITQVVVNKDFKGKLPAHSERLLATNDHLKQISGMKNHPEFIAIAKKPNLALPRKIKRIIFLDHLQNPGNIGSIIRSALAFNFDALYFCPKCCDPFNDKAMRAAKSSIFHLPIFKMEFNDFIKKYSDFMFFQANLSGQNIKSTKIDKKSVLIFSNEGSGPTKTLEREAIPIAIPMNPKVESLNVAAAANIIMHHFSELELSQVSS